MLLAGAKNAPFVEKQNSKLRLCCSSNSVLHSKQPLWRAPIHERRDPSARLDEARLEAVGTAGRAAVRLELMVVSAEPCCSPGTGVESPRT